MRVLWYLYWTVALGTGAAALFLTFACRKGSGNAHIRASVRLQAVMFVHYTLSAALFYAVRFDGMNRYFSGFRIIPAYAVFLLLAAAMVFVSVSILTVESHGTLRCLAVVQLAFLPFMVVIDQLRYFFPMLWSLRPEERLIVLPLFYIVLNVCLVLYARSGGYAFTPREKEVAQLLGGGSSYKDIANTLCVSLSTVQTHVKSIYRKTGINSKYELMEVIRGDA